MISSFSRHVFKTKINNAEGCIFSCYIESTQINYLYAVAPLSAHIHVENAISLITLVVTNRPGGFHTNLSLVHKNPVARGKYLALAFIQCFIYVSIAPESPDFKSAECKAVNLGQHEIFTFHKLKND